ncbi:fimbrial protein [Aeromonas veronii]|uniref:fimbrial protein n=1 Tax=Aeromonas veronii TaxID=654 RepID=UPI003D1DB0B8
MTIKIATTLGAIVALLFYSASARAIPCGPGPGGLRIIEASSISGGVPSDGSSPLGEVSTWDLSTNSTIICRGAPNTDYTGPTYFSFRLPSSAENYSHNGRDYISFNEYIGISAEIYVSGKLNSFVKVLHDSQPVSNLASSTYKTDSGGNSVINSVGTGGKGNLYVHIKKPFIGSMLLNRTVIARLHASRITPDVDEMPFADVYVSGKLTSNSSCAFEQGVYQVDFGGMAERAIKPITDGSEQYAKQLTLSLSCSGPIADNAVDISLMATPDTRDTTLIATNLSGLGIKTVANDNTISPIPIGYSLPSAEQRIHLEGTGTGPRSATVTFIPVRTEQEIQIGKLDTSATLLVNFE